MSETPQPRSADSNIDPGWHQVAQEIHTYPPALQEHAARNLAERGIKISPEPHPEQRDTARPVLPTLDELPPDEPDFVGEVLATGQEAGGGDRVSLPSQDRPLTGARLMPSGDVDYSQAAVVTVPTKRETGASKGPLLGVIRRPDGDLDYSKAAVVTGHSKSGESTSEHAETPRRASHLEGVLADAEKVGIDESRLKQLSQVLRMLDRPLEQDLALKRIVKRDGMSIRAEELRTLTRRYQKEVIRAREKGTLYHYHQTYLGKLESILDNGGLLSTDAQRRLGFEIKSAGSRPDVVQMTRDKYDGNGNVVATGIKATSAGLGVAGEIGFVIDEAIMDDPAYDCIVQFPNAPSVPLSQIRAIIVSDEARIPFVEELLSKKGIDKAVVSRTEWLSNYQK